MIPCGFGGPPAHLLAELKRQLRSNLVDAVLSLGAGSPVSLGIPADRVRSLQRVGASGARRTILLHEGFYATTFLPGDQLIAITATGPHTVESYGTAPYQIAPRAPR